MMKEEDTKQSILLSKINQIDIDILSYQNAIIESNGKEPLLQETVNFYQQQINELVLMKSELEKI